MNMRDKCIEAGARAICRVQFQQSGQFGRKGIDKQTEKYWREWLPEAHLAFHAMIEKLMEPDEEMLEAGAKEVDPTNPHHEDVACNILCAALSSLREGDPK